MQKNPSELELFFSWFHDEGPEGQSWRSHASTSLEPRLYGRISSWRWPYFCPYGCISLEVNDHFWNGGSFWMNKDNGGCESNP